MDIVLFGLIFLIIISTTVYHMVEKYFGELKNPFFLLANIYLVIVIILVATNLVLDVTFKELLMGFNLPILMVAFGSVMYNMFLILSYRHGAKISTMFNIITPSVSIAFIVIGLIFFKEDFNLLNALGILFALAGIYFLTYKRGENNEK